MLHGDGNAMRRVHGGRPVLVQPQWNKLIGGERYLAGIEAKDPSALLVSLADKVHNARAILADYRKRGEGLWDRFSGGRDGTLWYYRSLVRAFRRRLSTPRWSRSSSGWWPSWTPSRGSVARGVDPGRDAGPARRSDPGGGVLEGKGP